MKDIAASLIQNQQNMMSEMHKDFMSLIREYMSSNGDIHDFSNVGDEESADKVEKIAADDEVNEYAAASDRIPEESHEGYEFDSLGDPELPCLDNIDEINIDDPKWASGVETGIPYMVHINFGRGPIDTLLPIKKGLYTDYGS